jgi:hypothetical protein
LDALISQDQEPEGNIIQGQVGGVITKIDEVAIYYLNDLGLPTSPHVKLMFADKEITAIADSGAEVCLMSEKIYEELILPVLPTWLVLIIYVKIYAHGMDNFKFTLMLLTSC